MIHTSRTDGYKRISTVDSPQGEEMMSKMQMGSKGDRTVFAEVDNQLELEGGEEESENGIRVSSDYKL